MNNGELETLLGKLPLEQRSEAREFARMSPEAQRIFLFMAVHDVRNDLMTLRNAGTLRSVLTSSGVTALTGLSIVWAIVTGKLPTS